MKKLSKLMSLVLALAMCLSLLPATALAAGNEPYAALCDENGNDIATSYGREKTDDTKSLTVNSSEGLEQVFQVRPRNIEDRRAYFTAFDTDSTGDLPSGCKLEVLQALTEEIEPYPDASEMDDIRSVDIQQVRLTIPAGTSVGEYYIVLEPMISRFAQDNTSWGSEKYFYFYVNVVDDTSDPTPTEPTIGKPEVTDDTITITVTGDPDATVDLSDTIAANMPEDKEIDTMSAEGGELKGNTVTVGEDGTVTVTVTLKDKEPVTPPASTDGVVSYDVSMEADASNPVDKDLKVGSEIRTKLTITGTTNNGGTTKDFYTVKNLVVNFDKDFFAADVEGDGAGFAAVDNDNGIITINCGQNNSTVSRTDADLPTLVFTVVKESFEGDNATGSITLPERQSGMYFTSENAADYTTGEVSADVTESTVSATLTKTTYDPITGEPEQPGNTVRVTFSAGDHGALADSAAATMDVVKGAEITADDLPGVTANVNAGYTFSEKWTADGTNEVTFPYTVNADVTLTAMYTSDTVEIEDKPTDPTPDNPGWENGEDDKDPTTGETYTGKINPYLPDVYDYEVTYGQGDDRSGTASAGEDGKFTIPGTAVKPGLGITITATLKGEPKVYGYAGNVAMILMKANSTDGKLTDSSAAIGGYTYNDKPMLWSETYGGYVYLTKAEGSKPAAELGTNIKFVADIENKTAPAPDKDVTGNRQTDERDATYIISIIKGAYSAYITETAVVENYLRADLMTTDLSKLAEGNQIIDIEDYKAWYDTNS